MLSTRFVRRSHFFGHPHRSKTPCSDSYCSSECPTGPLTLASAACPALRELELDLWYLDQPPAPLAHLTLLNITAIDVPPEGAAPLRCLAAAAPRLEVLKYGECWDPSMVAPTVAAAVGHPCMRELIMCCDREAWLRAALRLPALVTLEMGVEPCFFEGKEVEVA